MGDTPNTQAGAKLYIASAAVIGLPLTKAQFEALTWVEVKKVGKFGETGADTSIVSYDTHDTEVTQKGKGITNAGDTDVEVARVYNDPGQILVRAACRTKFNYAFKREMADAPAAGYTNTITYYAGVVTGPKHPNGGNEDFDLDVFVIGQNQLEVVVDPAVV